MSDADRLITESFTAERGTVVMEDVPFKLPRRAPARTESCWYGRRAPQLTYATPARRALCERVLCAALAVLNPHNRRR
jgi:hypothetical protein